MQNAISTPQISVSVCEQSGVGAVSVSDSCSPDSCVPDSDDVSKFQAAFKVLAGKWKVEILFALIKGPRRFGDLRRAIPDITQHMLTAKLRELANSGLVRRTSYGNEKLPHVEYELTEAAYGLGAVFEVMVGWSDRFGVVELSHHI